MKGLAPLLLGIAGTFLFSWVGLALIPNFQIGHLDPQMDEEGNDAYPIPRSGLAERGRAVYVANGCVYCHTQQVRADYAGADIDRKWGVRRSAPRDYLFDRPVLLGKMRMGPDLANVGKRAPVEDENAAPVASTSPPAAGSAPPPAPPAPASSATGAPTAMGNPLAANPSGNSAVQAGGAATGAVASPGTSPAPSVVAAANPALNAATSADTGQAKAGPLPYSAAWHHQHLYVPRSINPDSNMPAFRFLYEKRKVSGQRAADALQLVSHGAEQDEWEIVPTYDARCLVAYLMSLDQSHELKEAKSNTPASPPAPGKQAK